jgi:hypothetical protein
LSSLYASVCPNNIWYWSSCLWITQGEGERHNKLLHMSFVHVHIVVLRTHKHIQITFIFFFFFLLSLVMCVHKASLTHTSHHTFEIVYVCVDASSLVRSAPPSSPRRQRNAAFIKHLKSRAKKNDSISPTTEEGLWWGSGGKKMCRS